MSDKAELNKAVILGATGACGIHLAQELCRRSISTRVVSRSPENLTTALADYPVDPVAADLRNSDDAARVLKCCDIVFNCIGVPLPQMDDYVAIARNIASTAAERALRVIHVSGYWSYHPIEHLPLSESHPRRDGPVAARLRREAEEILREAGAAVVTLPDLYGPEVQTSTLQRALGDMVNGKPVSWIGSTTTKRDYAYVPDAMATVANLASREECYGKHWVLAGAGPISLEQVAEIAQRHLGRRPELRGASRWRLRLASVLSPQLRAMRPLVPFYMQPISFDDKRLRRLVPKPRPTPYDTGIPQTLSWIAREARRRITAELVVAQ